jgi:hypothetical protein
VTYFVEEEYGLQDLDNMVWNYTEVGMLDGFIDRDGYWYEPSLVIIANKNSSNWNEISAENGDREFAISFNDWQNPRWFARQWIRSVIGLKWIDKFDLRIEKYFVDTRETGTNSITIYYGVCAVANIIYCTVM